MHIVADAGIPYLDEAFGRFDSIERLPGRDITRASLVDADALLVRTVTQIDPALLEGTPVRFVGTASIGTDHIDVGGVEALGITVASAPGCNRHAVGNYLTAALLELEAHGALTLEHARIGIVGVGNVGSVVAQRAVGLGMTPVLHDTPRFETTNDPQFLNEEAIPGCDVVTLHVPLTHDGRHPTFHLIDEAFLGRLSPGTIVINTSRGAVVDNNALSNALSDKRIGGAVLDVWENEPLFDPELAERVAIATPHIAGYSIDGKANATTQVYDAFCRTFGHMPEPNPTGPLPPAPVPTIDLDSRAPDAPLRAVRAAYDILADDAAVRRAAECGELTRGAAFEDLRRNYTFRHEFHHTTVRLSPYDRRLATQLTELGFSVASV